MPTTTTTSRSEETQVYRVYIKASPEAIWDAITSPEWTQKYGYGAGSEYELRPGGAYRVFACQAMKAYGGPDVVVDGEVVEADPPRKLVQTWRPLWDPEMLAEGFQAPDLGDRGGRGRRHDADRDSRARTRTEDGSTGVWPDPRGWRRLELHPQRSKNTPRDGQGAWPRVRLSAVNPGIVVDGELAADSSKEHSHGTETPAPA